MNDGLRRLKVLVQVVLPAVKEENFDLRVWQCGTSACALGWGCMYKPFQEEGLRLSTKTAYPLYKESKGIEAAEEFFELNYKEARDLFYRSHYNQENPTVNDVITKIKKVIKKKKDEE
jgi:hypothetical protein